ncbi:MAG: hypothetical protein EOO04_27430, partial [Chitinophagaceae bacterium]
MIRHSAFAIAIAGTSFITGCDKDDDNEETKPLTITETVVANPGLSLLEAAVVKAGLAQTLSTTANLTVFAPDDAAFKMLDLNGDGTPDLDTEAKINALDAAGVTLLEQFLAHFPHNHLSLVPHAPYSVSATLFQLLNRQQPGALISIHNQE